MSRDAPLKTVAALHHPFVILSGKVAAKRPIAKNLARSCNVEVRLYRQAA